MIRSADRAVSAEPRSYTPKHLAEKILTSRAALEGERKQVTVLFADVKGSMELAEQLDPEEWHKILDRFFQAPWSPRSGLEAERRSSGACPRGCSSFQLGLCSVPSFLGS